MRNWAWAAAWGVAGLGIVLASPALAQKGKRPPCISEQELEAAFGAQIDAGVTMLRTAEIDDGRPMCAGTTVARWIHRRREAAFPAERDERLARAEMVKADVARLAAEEAESRDRRRDAERLEELARIAEAKRDAAEADAGSADAQLREQQTLRKLAALPPLERRSATILLDNDPGLDATLDQIVREDAKSWLFNRYRADSMHDSSFIHVGSKATTYEAIGYFSYENGGEGSVIARFHRDQLECLEFSDQPGVCRKLGNSRSMQNLVALGQTIVWGLVSPRLGLR